MEIVKPTLTETKGRMRRLYLIYGLSGIILLITLSGAILTKKYTESLYATFDRLQTFNLQYIKVRSAVDDIEKTLMFLRTALPKDSSWQSAEERMLLALDELKSKSGSSEVTVANIEDKGADLQLPVTIKAPLKDYTSLVNFVGYLQSLKFPFFGITNIKIQQGGDPTARATFFEIKGALKYPKTSLPPQGAATKGVPGKS